MKSQKGQALVETAIILPLLILLIMGLFEFGRFLYLKNTINNAARAGARTAAVTPKYDAALHPGGMASSGKDSHTLSCSTDEFKSEDGDVYRSVCDAIYNGIPKNEVVVSIAYTDLAPPTGLNAGDSVSVTLRWDKFEPVFPLLTPITNLITAQAAMRYE